MNLDIPSEIILKILEKENIEVKETSDDNEIRINSIYAEDKKFKLYISLSKKVFHCFKSGENGKISKLLSDILGLEKTNIEYEIIKKYYGRNYKKEIIKEIKKEENLELPEGLVFFNEDSKSIFRRKAYNYLVDRGLTEEKINELGFIINSDSHYHNRIFIPFYEEEKLVYFQTRDFTNTSKLRFVNPKGFSSKQFVYNVDKIDEEVVILEGLFDAMVIDNIPATAIMSADLTMSQAKKIMWKAPKDIIIVPDNDETGERTLKKNIELLNYVKPKSLNYNIWLYHLPKEFKDFNEFANKTNEFFIDKQKIIRYNKNRFIGHFKFSDKREINLT